MVGQKRSREPEPVATPNREVDKMKLYTQAIKQARLAAATTAASQTPQQVIQNRVGRAVGTPRSQAIPKPAYAAAAAVASSASAAAAAPAPTPSLVHALPAPPPTVAAVASSASAVPVKRRFKTGTQRAAEKAAARVAALPVKEQAMYDKFQQEVIADHDFQGGDFWEWKKAVDDIKSRYPNRRQQSKMLAPYDYEKIAGDTLSIEDSFKQLDKAEELEMQNEATNNTAVRTVSQVLEQKSDEWIEGDETILFKIIRDNVLRRLLENLHANDAKPIVRDRAGRLLERAVQRQEQLEKEMGDVLTTLVNKVPQNEWTISKEDEMGIYIQLHPEIHDALMIFWTNPVKKVVFQELTRHLVVYDAPRQALLQLMVGELAKWDNDAALKEASLQSHKQQRRRTNDDTPIAENVTNDELEQDRRAEQAERKRASNLIEHMAQVSSKAREIREDVDSGRAGHEEELAANGQPIGKTGGLHDRDDARLLKEGNEMDDAGLSRLDKEFKRDEEAAQIALVRVRNEIQRTKKYVPYEMIERAENLAKYIEVLKRLKRVHTSMARSTEQQEDFGETMDQVHLAQSLQRLMFRYHEENVIVSLPALFLALAEDIGVLSLDNKSKTWVRSMLKNGTYPGVLVRAESSGSGRSQGQDVFVGWGIINNLNKWFNTHRISKIQDVIQHVQQWVMPASAPVAHGTSAASASSASTAAASSASAASAAEAKDDDVAEISKADMERDLQRQRDGPPGGYWTDNEQLHAMIFHVLSRWNSLASSSAHEDDTQNDLSPMVILHEGDGKPTYCVNLTPVTGKSPAANPMDKSVFLEVKRAAINLKMELPPYMMTEMRAEWLRLDDPDFEWTLDEYKMHLQKLQFVLKQKSVIHGMEPVAFAAQFNDKVKQDWSVLQALIYKTSQGIYDDYNNRILSSLETIDGYPEFHFIVQDVVSRSKFSKESLQWTLAEELELYLNYYERLGDLIKDLNARTDQIKSTHSREAAAAAASTDAAAAADADAGVLRQAIDKMLQNIRKVPDDTLASAHMDMSS
jgi:hypothetical protein